MLQLDDANLDAAKLHRLLDKCRSNVPGLIELHFGKNDMNMYPNKVEGSGGHNYALFSRHIHADALRQYHDHPDHVVLATFLMAIATRPPQVIDFRNMSKL